MADELEIFDADEELSLLETLDHVLDRGIVAQGDITISVANIDLIYLNLGLLLGSVETVNKVLNRRLEAAPARVPDVQPDGEAAGPGAKGLDTGGGGNVLLPERLLSPPQSREPDVLKTRAEESVEELRHVSDRLPERINVDSRSVEQGLAKLVLTLIELIRRLLEKQAVRRMEGGRLTEAQVEELGLALMKLEEKMRELKGQFGLEDDDLNLDLGPVGRLI